MPDDVGGKAAEWIFVSYRRADSVGHAQSVYFELVQRYGPDAVFFDTEKIDIGAHFPARLAAAMQMARLLIAVIGPDWLDTLNERAVGPKVDYVREELRLALERRKGGTLTIQPVLVGGAQAPDRQDLAEALRDELGDLTLINAHPLRPVPGWRADFDALHATVIGPIRAELPAVYAAQREVEEHLRKKVADLLAEPHMDAVRAAWRDDPLQERRSADAWKLLIEFSKALKAARVAWTQPGKKKLAASQVPVVEESCRRLVALLFRLAVDVSAVRVWHAGGNAAPVEQPGTAALVTVAAQADAADIWASPRSRGSTFHAERTVELGDGLDAGIGTDREEQVFREFWAMAFETEAPATGGALRDDALRDLRNRLKARTAQDDHPFGATARVTSDNERNELRRLVEKLTVRAYGRTGQHDSPLLSHDEGELVAALCVCLEELAQIRKVP